MSSRFLLFLCLPLFAQEGVHCPIYPAGERDYLTAQTERARTLAEFSRSPARSAITINLPRANFIDSYLFSRMEADGVVPAPLSTDAEFLRRVTLDLTGRIPSWEEAEQFLSSAAADKRVRLIDRLLASPAFADHWAFHFAERTGLTTGVFVSAVARNAAHQVLHEWIASDVPLDALATRMITAAGDPAVNPAVVFPLLAADVAGTVQDFWDNQTDRVTTQWLGLKTECISCHTGRFYLNRINLDLAARTRQDFWRLSAFMARTRYLPVYSEATGGVPRFLLVDRDSGAYHGAVPPAVPGVRPLRQVSDLSPTYIYTGEEPSSPNWRNEMARIVTRDRQFARAQINYLWAYLFRSGIVDPPNGWDLKRTDPSLPIPENWTPQNLHPELLERLATALADNRFSLKAALRLLTNSTVYQLSSAYPSGAWRPAYGAYYARAVPRRLTAEELVDAVAVATETVRPIYLDGRPAPVYFAEQLPDNWEPALAPSLGQLLDRLGRGRRNDNSPRRSRPELLGMLAFMNSGELVSRTTAALPGLPLNRVSRIAALDLTDEEAVRRLFLSTLTRYPTAAETAAALTGRAAGRTAWLSDLQWALIQKLDFVFCL